MEQARKTVEIKTSTLIIISMIAGVGLAQIEVSTWWGIALDTVSALFNAVMGTTKEVAANIKG